MKQKKDTGLSKYAKGKGNGKTATDMWIKMKHKLPKCKMKKETINKYKLVYIEWEDSLCGSNHWIYERDVDYKNHERHILHISVGFVVNETKRSVFLSNEMMKLKLEGEDGSLISPGSIPKSAIRRIKVLKI